MSRTGQWLSFLLARAAGRPNSAVIDEPDLVRRRQLKKIGVILVSLVAAGALVTAAFKIFAGDKGAKKDAHRPQVKLLQDKVAMEIKQSEDLGQLKYLQDENKALRDDILNLKGEVTRKSSGTSRSETGSRPNGPAGKQRLFIPPEPPSGPGLTAPVPQFDAPHAGVEENTGRMPLRLPFMPVQKSGGPAAGERQTPAPVGGTARAAFAATSSIRVFGESVVVAGKETRKKKGEQGKKTWIPSGSFVAGQLLSGLDAPTGGYSQSNPHPVLIRLSDLAILPGRQRMDIKECFVVGAGYGDMASERAYIRTESLSCVRKDRTTVDLPIKGYVVGEDGKVGLRGRLVSKQGQMLAQALLAGLASGMSEAFKPITPTYYASTTDAKDGRMVFPNPQDVLQAGAMGGMSKALDRLSHFYIDMAKQVFPIIEVDAGRRVEVVVLKGIEIVEDKVAGE